MQPDALLTILHTTEALKNTTRHCYTSAGRHESVAEHSWRIALMAFLMQDEFPSVNIDKVIRMCLIHDLGEIFTGDIPVFQKTADHEQIEEDLLNTWVAGLPAPFSAEFASLFAEMKALQSPEAKLYKAMDSLEAVIQHNESDISTWEDHEYRLQLDYAWNRTSFSPYLTRLREAIRDETIRKIQTESDYPLTQEDINHV